MPSRTNLNQLFRTVAIVVMTSFITAVVIAWAARHTYNYGERLSQSQQELLTWLADFPSNVVKISQAMRSQSRAPLTDWLIEKGSVESDSFFERWPSREDPGYLLLSGFNDETESAVVDLLRVSDGARLMRWRPSWEDINARTTHKKFAWNDGSAESRAVHPLVLPDGDIVFNTGSALVRFDACRQQADWILDDVFHHSVELSANGTIWVPIVVKNPFPENRTLNRVARDDGLAEVSLDGRVLRIISFSRVLLENDLRALVLGLNDSRFSYDLLHLNQITPALSDGEHWKTGDLLVSSRRLSAVFLYRPASNKIVWFKMGPWLNQHSVAFLGEDAISVFDNNVVWGLPTPEPFFMKDDHNRVLIWSLSSDEVSEPFKGLLSRVRPRTVTQGRSQVLADGGLFIEETNSGRLLRFSGTELLWSKVNWYGDKYIAKLAWSRYVEKADGDLLLQALAGRDCRADNAGPNRQ
jgi:hypothetical protein